jgi:enoyl-CoA hydratase/carnithine racemase
MSMSGSSTSGADESPVIVIEKSGHVGWLIFNRPASGNALNAQMLDELEHAWLELDEDPAVRAIVNTGNGDAFCTGLDVVQLAENKAVLREHSRRTRDAELKMTAWHLGISTPVICAVNGVCAGGGLHFVADADIVIASANATFVDPHVSVGQAVAYEEIALAKSSPMEPIMRMSLVGRHERMSARRAYQLGIISQVVDAPGELRSEASKLAEKIAKNSPSALAASKRAIWAALEFTGNRAAKPPAASP